MQNVLALPKLTNATLKSVTKQIPDGSIFSDREAVKMYWEEVHGYTLNVDGGAKPSVYYNITFNKGHILTYHEWTIRSSPHHI